MAILFVFIAVLIAGVLSVLLGESRYDDEDRRGWWPGVRRR
jgi:hypothetical protein